MKLNDDMAKVICDLEYEIGSECYNPHSYDDGMILKVVILDIQ